MGSIEPWQPLDDAGQEQIAEAFRLECGRVVASVLRIVREIDAAEETAHEAFGQALNHWPAHGTPDHSGACAVTAAQRERRQL